MPERSPAEVSENENDSAALDALRELAEALKKSPMGPSMRRF